LQKRKREERMIRPIKFKPMVKKPTGHATFVRAGFPLLSFDPEKGVFVYSNRVKK
jgi:hypothetical protein